MKTILRFSLMLALITLAMLQTGCATHIKGGGFTKMPVTSSPAGLPVYRDNGQLAGTTPCEIKLWNNATHRVCIVNGDRAYAATLSPRPDGWAISGSIFFLWTGFPGMAGLPIDAVSGADMRLNANHVFADFDKVQNKAGPAIPIAPGKNQQPAPPPVSVPAGTAFTPAPLTTR